MFASLSCSDWLLIRTSLSCSDWSLFRASLSCSDWSLIPLPTGGLVNLVFCIACFPCVSFLVDEIVRWA